MLASGGENQGRSRRPRPAVCLSATTTVPSGKGLFTRSKVNVLVEGNSLKTNRDWLSIFDGSIDVKISVDNMETVMAMGGRLGRY